MNTKAIHTDRKLRHLSESDRQMEVRRVAVIGNYLPRQCGIATFTTDLCDALVAEYEELQVYALAVNDTETGYEYPARVRYELQEQDLASYLRAANYLDLSNIDLVCVQHEFGIFGGQAGSHILELLRELRMPIVTTLHTVFQEPPEPEFDEVFAELIRLTDRAVVMSHRAADILHNHHKVPREKIDLIPHGIHDLPFVDPNFYKDKFDVEGRFVILTFGLLGPPKGIEHTIGALPQICRRYPKVTYIILGVTHPYWLRTQGESYRESLQKLAHDLGVEDHVIFHNRFVGTEELLECIGAADVYITPYLEPQQVSSGTLAYAVGAGKAVVSTPYQYAEELLADGRGRLVPFRDSNAIAQEILDLLDDPAQLHATRKRAFLHGREMIWPKVARRYMRAFVRAREERMKQPRAVHLSSSSLQRPVELPTIKLDHLRRLTDDTGVVRHAVFTVPNRDDGYTTDDNARALILAVLLEELEKEPVVTTARLLSETYLAFLGHAFNKDTGRFRNSMGYDRRWEEDTGSEDCHGRGLWALGVVAGRSDNTQLRGAAAGLFSMALPAALEITSPRCWAFTLIGIYEYMRRFYGDHEAQTIRRTLANRLLDMYRRNSSAEWPWFEDTVSYANAKLAQALILSGRWIPSDEMIDAGLRALRWLADIQQGKEGRFSPIGNQGFHQRGGERARFHQQPVEAASMVSACLEAYRVTDEDRWRWEARRAFDWFLGQNDVKLPIYDASTGGCRDVLHPDRTSANQGAEATIAFLFSLAQMRMVERALSPGERPLQKGTA